MKVAILGLGVDTQDVVPYLKNRGDEVVILDEAKGDKFDNLSRFDLIIRSPGVYRYRPEILAAEKAGVEISSKTKLFFDLCPAKIIGVTGTKGKGTTATLIYEILKAAGKRVFLGGNIGSGVFGILERLRKDDWVVLELSSFQLVDLQKSPHITVVLMVTSEHLDWHPTIKEYVDAKKNIVSHQTKNDFAIISDDYSNSKLIGQEGKGNKFYFSRQHEVEKGCFLMQKHLINRLIRNQEIIIDQSEIKLRGEHNIENVMAAIVATRLVGVSIDTIREVLKKFKGLEHRLEEIATVNGITFYNDSFSTTPETAIAAIKSFKEPLVVILGGSEKGSDFTDLGKAIVETQNVKAIILIGLMTDRILAAVERFARPGLANTVRKPRILRGGKDMAEIVRMAYNNAASGDVVLLSPACASFDMFANYKDRGKQFKDQVAKLVSNDKN